MAVAVADLLNSEINKPARYLGQELGAIHKPWDNAQVRWVLSYPELYEVGASNLGHIILYNIINAQPDQLCDRAYLPAPDLAAKLRATQTPLFAVESRRSLQEFDIIGLSLSYELGATNILEMLNLAGIPLTSHARQNGHYPLIFAGGPTATGNPEPYADFFDFFALGDGEELLPEIGLVLQEGKSAGLSRRELLLDLAQIPGVYVPEFYAPQPDASVIPLRNDVPKKILRRVATPIPAYGIGLVPYVETVHDRLTVEIRRGCTRGCRFCQPGMLTRPARDVAPETVIQTIEQGMRATGFNEFSLLSLSCSDYLSLPSVGLEIKQKLHDQPVSLSLPSQRVDRFDEHIAEIIGGTRKGGLTFAPEAGTQRLRDIINKGLTNEELLRGIKTAWEQGWDRVKLYFMIGLPGETDVDVIGIAETLKWLQRECRGNGRKPLGFNVTISNFTPKPHTPFQWHSVATAEFIRKQELLKQEFKVIRNVKANFTDVRISAMEDFLGRGDRSLGKVIQRAWELGAGMDAWWESLERAYGAWSQAIEASNLTWKYRTIEQGQWFTSVDSEQLLTQDLPWDHLDTGIEKKWLVDDLERALATATVPDCSFEGCSHCGVCGVDLGHNVVVPPPPLPTGKITAKIPTERVQRLRVKFGKQGDLALLSHLDLVRLFDRAMRRANLPISYSEGFHPGARLMPASALPLGATSVGEIIDFELYQTCPPQDFLQKLKAQLPTDIPLYEIAEIPVNHPSNTQLLIAAQYRLTLELDHPLANPAWESWVHQIIATSELWWEGKTKSGKPKRINLREKLHHLHIIKSDQNQAEIAYEGAWSNDGQSLHPDHVLFLFQMVGIPEINLIHIHREQLIFRTH
ncbi:Fe-S oxidoreductase [Gloeomargarita lithophora Alchichica-D10]|uniref:Fe-S oxidoreductase n=1 Tax=Gloeomargarita lithophora Alchichica-D10 TaxID=1188229 RepID=A0A1J0A8R4_9CYAN|nr:Fe-S oxidoreductase [Gloeomargarita lithophora Alchichica-D10]